MGDGIREADVAGMPRAFRPSARELAIAGALFAAALVWFSLGLTRTFHPRDEAYLLRLSARVAAGEMPHRDFVDVYGPATFTVTGAVMRAFGEQVLPVRIFLAVVKALAVAVGYLLTRALATRSFAVFGALLAIAFWGRVTWNLNAPYASLYTVAFTPLALALLIVSELRRSKAGLVAAGAAAGATILFKQSLAGPLLYGMALVLWGAAMLSATPGRNSRRETWIGLSAWALAGVVPLLPVLGFLTAFDYALHILPIHVLMAIVAAAALRRGGTGPLAAIVAARLLPFALGAGGVLVAVTALYASWGAAGVLIDDMFVLPLTLENYAVPVELPSPGLALAASGLMAAVGAGLLGLAGRRPAAGGLMVAASVLLGIAILWTETSPWVWVLQGARQLGGVQPAALAWAGLATLARLLIGGRSLERPALVAWLGLAFFHVCLAFQGFPRAGPDLYIAQGAQMLLLAVVLSTWHQRIKAGSARRARRGAAALLLAVVPLWLVLPVVTGTLRGVRTADAFSELHFPQTEGISLPRVAIERLGIQELEDVSARLAAEPGTAPVLLLSNAEVILFASGRQPLLPRLRAHLFWIGWGMGSRREPEALEAKLLQRLEASPAALAVDAQDPSTRRLRRALPRVSAYLDQHYRVRERIGRYRILVRADPRMPGDATMSSKPHSPGGPDLGRFSPSE